MGVEEYILVDEMATPEGNSSCIHFFVTEVVGTHVLCINIQSQIKGHAEAQTTVYPAFTLSATTGLADRHEGKCLDSAELGILVLVIFQNQTFRFFEEMIARRVWVQWVGECPSQ